eukprot:GFYU01059203.1.p1 GENE.GFYU01059203.1~~GFYU01059203.1.p1  ORF type:complete len:138 (+),score=20.19 GFYU01059203.1:58-471(+)
MSDMSHQDGKNNPFFGNEESDSDDDSMVASLRRGIANLNTAAVGGSSKATGDSKRKLVSTELIKGKTVLFVGRTGVGKSTLCNRLTGTNQATTNDSVDSCTQTIVECTGNGIICIDTPGLEDTERRDEHHLKTIRSL